MKWIKLHCEKWFLGSTRWELDAEERAIWIDCLARAGLNNPSGQVDYYNLQQIADQFKSSLEFLEKTLRKFVQLEKISWNGNSIKIINWEKYQSEYLRQKPSRKKLQKEQEKKKEESTEKVQIPDWVPLKEFEAYKKMRKTIRKPLTSEAELLVFRKLEKLQAQGYSPVDVLNQSILNSWQGLFTIKKDDSEQGIFPIKKEKKEESVGDEYKYL